MYIHIHIHIYIYIYIHTYCCLFRVEGRRRRLSRSFCRTSRTGCAPGSCRCFLLARSAAPAETRPLPPAPASCLFFFHEVQDLGLKVCGTRLCLCRVRQNAFCHTSRERPASSSAHFLPVCFMGFHNLFTGCSFRLRASPETPAVWGPLGP